VNAWFFPQSAAMGGNGVISVSVLSRATSTEFANDWQTNAAKPLGEDQKTIRRMFFWMIAAIEMTQCRGGTIDRLVYHSLGDCFKRGQASFKMPKRPRLHHLVRIVHSADPAKVQEVRSKERRTEIADRRGLVTRQLVELRS
jgi:hypothetical protein